MLLYGLSATLLVATCALHVAFLHRFWRVSRSEGRIGRLPVRGGHSGFRRPVHPFTRDEPRFEDAW